ncbi:MAG TPA: LytTR family DNA-binding domain-containing protein [Burkholderiaceae bacterium]
MTEGADAGPSAVIADDEPQLLDYLRKRLAHVWPELRVVGEARDGPEALEMIRQLRPSYAFLDIQMPGLSGLEVAEQVAADCQVAFVTAHDQYAIDAFERAAIDYLLKPVSDERLSKTVERLRRSEAPAPTALSELQNLIRQLRPGQAYVHWLQVSVRDEVTLLPVSEVDLFQSTDKYTLLANVKGEWLIRTALKDLEPQLDPAQFWRIHRGAIVRVGAIERVLRGVHGQFAVKLNGHARKIPVSRPYAFRFKAI